jgi:hypothetical protein
MMYVRIDWLKDGRMKIKLTNIGIGKYVQQFMYDICFYWGRSDKMDKARKEEGKSEERS